MLFGSQSCRRPGVDRLADLAGGATPYRRLSPLRRAAVRAQCPCRRAIAWRERNPMDEVLRVAGIGKRFGRRWVLNGVELAITSGACALLCGENGAGKSTLMRILAGLEKPDAARVELPGGPRTWRQARSDLLSMTVYLHQQPYLFDGTVRRNLAYGGIGAGVDKAARVDDALAWAGLAELAERHVRGLSGGERQRVALARAWVRRPTIILFNKPTININTKSKHHTLQLIHILKSQNINFIITTHNPKHFKSLNNTQ